MIAIISPAKNMRNVPEKPDLMSSPGFLEKTGYLAGILKGFQPWELEELMKINEKLGMQAFVDYQNFSAEKEKGSPALLSYDGIVFKHIQADDFSGQEMEYAQGHVRILSGLYGMLRPKDAIMHYRLEMGCKVKICKKNLYQFWQESIYKELYKETDFVVNLASEEYAKIIRKYLQNSDQFLDIEFLSMKNGRLKNVTVWAKMARGQMIRYMVKHKITKPEELKNFQFGTYEFEEAMSTEYKYVFTGTPFSVS